jgi:hypothetical protein
MRTVTFSQIVIFTYPYTFSSELNKNLGVLYKTKTFISYGFSKFIESRSQFWNQVIFQYL